MEPVRPRVALFAFDRGEGWIETLDREALEVRVTSLERTLADVLDRPSLAGGIEAVWRSLAALPAVDPVAVLASTLEALQRLLPGHPVYMERALGGRLNRRWRLIVPAQLAGPPEEAGA